MSASFDFWKFLAGVGLFLFAMAQLEAALSSVAGRSFRQFLRGYTRTPTRSVLTGTAVTAMVQSSSLVGLMVLAFVGAGIMTLPSALGVIFGSNLGTTFTGWIVVTLGFKLDIQALALPLIGVGSLVLVSTQGRLAAFGRLAAGLGFLLLGLDFMKDSVASIRQPVDAVSLAGFASWQYFFFGVVFAAIVQSSSATMLVAIAALDAGLISLVAAAEIAIGADLGTCSTIILGSFKGAAAKRRVALAHLLFNLGTVIIAYGLRIQLLAIVAAAGIHDPLLALVAFHTLFNVLGVAVFLPFTTLMARQLDRLFIAPTERHARYVTEVSPSVSDAALEAINEETAHLIASVTMQNMQAFSPALPLPPGQLPVAVALTPDLDVRSFDEMYRRTKRLEGEILAFATRVQSEPLEPDESLRLTQLLSAIRSAVRSSKYLKDIHHNLEEFGESPKPAINTYLQHVQSVMTAFYGELYLLRRENETEVLFEDLVEALQKAHEWHDQLHHDIFEDIRAHRISDTEISSCLNVNREILNSNVALLMAVSYYQLDAEQAESMARMPGVS
ncbi:MAG: Na/Pi cotransporter family protein [Gammaproteobacteria bacterium]|nr:MAG: Na/Pi cotransporter family protein [Gammaproteobacteria bacterium]